MKPLAFLLATLLPLHAGTGDKIVAAARQQIGVTLTYDPAYTSLAYPKTSSTTSAAAHARRTNS